MSIHGSCSACGKRFYSMNGEARHRHNFPALCTRNKRFARWAHDDNIRAMREKIEAMPIGGIFIGVWANGDAIWKGVFQVRMPLHPDPEISVKCLINCVGVLNEMDVFDRGTRLSIWLENKLRIEPIPVERWEGFHMLCHHEQVAAACDG